LYFTLQRNKKNRIIACISKKGVSLPVTKYIFGQVARLKGFFYACCFVVKEFCNVYPCVSVVMADTSLSKKDT